MVLTLSEYLFRDFMAERVDATIIAFGPANRVHFAASLRVHFHLVLSGTAHLELEEQQQCIELHQGEFALLLYGVAHILRASASGGSTISWEHQPVRDEPRTLRLGDRGPKSLSGSLDLPVVPHRGPVNRALPHVLHYSTTRTRSRSDQEVSDDMAHIEESCRGPGGAAFVFSLVQLYFLQTMRRTHADMQRILPMQLGAPEMVRMAALVRKMRAHPEKSWTVASLAQELGWSRSSFAAKFKAYAGMGPIKFVARTRLMRATAMLNSNPESPLWEVAKRVGYCTEAAFTRAFRSQFDISPSAYARSIRGQLTRLPTLETGGEEVLDLR